MQSVEITAKYKNMKIENVLQSLYPRLSYNMLQKALRKRDVKVNGTRVGRDYTVSSGDMLEVYIIDDILYGLSGSSKTGTSGENGHNPGGADGKGGDGRGTANRQAIDGVDGRPETGGVDDRQTSDGIDGRQAAGGSSGSSAGSVSLKAAPAGFGVVYEDKNILIANKAQGIPVHPDKEQLRGTLIDLVREYLRQKSETAGDARFQPSLCHRLDRNTGGLVIIAKNQESHDIILDKIESREIRKYYQCLVQGKMERKEAELRAYLWKDASKSRVFINERKTPGAAEIVTGYKVLGYSKARDISRLEVELVTGRTHQIRAHLAFIGHPVLGDGKYGTNAINRESGLKRQALWACRLKFDFAGNAGILNYLKGREFQVKPDFTLDV